MPNRIIKESIHDSERVNRMTDFQFRLWVSLITYVDDYGRGDARPAIIKGKCFPLRERLTNADINAALKELAGIGCVGLYEVDGKPYLYFPNWESHQRVRNKVSKFPAPQESAASCCDLPRVAARIQSNPNPESESNPKEITRVPRFMPPSIQEVAEYCRERKNNVDAEQFVDFYASKGWRVGNAAMKDWRAAIRTWEKRDKKPPDAKKMPSGKRDNSWMKEYS